MKFIDIDLDGLVVRAQLNEAGAPQTTQAVWDALPFGGRAAHAQISGDMFRMLEPTPVPEDLALENPETYQFPGELVFYPPIREIAFCLNEAMFSATDRPFQLTRLASIEGDFGAWAKRADELLVTGVRPIEFRRSADQETPFRYPEEVGSQRIRVNLGDASLRAEILISRSPVTAAAFAAALPLQGTATNSPWAGKVTRFRNGGRPDGRVPLNASESEATYFHWPRYIYYNPADQGVRVCYGNGREGSPFEPAHMIPVARIIEDIAPYAELASQQYINGQLPMSFEAE